VLRQGRTTECSAIGLRKSRWCIASSPSAATWGTFRPGKENAKVSAFTSAKQDRIARSERGRPPRPDIIIGSWCGKRFRAERVKVREGWDAIPAVRTGHIHEIKSAQIHRIIERWAEETRP
jgi:hypothetical protein